MKTISKELAQKITYSVCYDTRAYRYIYREGRFERLPLAWLDTAAAIDGWEQVEVKEA